jgi:shikimate kinase
MAKAIVLIGPMGVGKTTVGKKLARALKVSFSDTDALVVREHGEIAQIFADSGELTFRGYEEEAVKQALDTQGVVATGGGAILSELTQERLKSAFVVYLSTDGRHISSRLKGGKRPLVKNGFEDWKRIYEERKPVYERVANFTVDTSGQSLGATVSQIRNRLEQL